LFIGKKFTAYRVSWLAPVGTSPKATPKVSRMQLELVAIRIDEVEGIRAL